MKRCAWVLLVIGLVTAAETPKEDTTKKDRKGMQGTWKVVAIEVNGKKMATKDIEKEIGNYKWVITGDKITDQRKNEFRYKLDGTREPKQIDLANWMMMTAEGIYKLDDDDLKVCIGKTSRPTDFTAKYNSP